MTDDLRRDREVRDWIQGEAPERAPDRLRDAVRGELAQTRQEQATGPLGRRLTVVRTWAPAAVVIVAIAALAAGLLANRGTDGTAAATPTPPVASTAPSATPSPTPRPTPVGLDLPAGPAATRAFSPGLRFTVPVGWVMREDQPATTYLSPADAGFLRQGDGAVAFDGINAYSAPLAGPPDGGPTPVDGIATTPKELAAWLSTRPQLLATKPVQVSVAGRPAWQLDFRLSPEAGVLCGLPCVNLLNHAANGYQFGIEGPWQVRAYLLDAGGGRPVMITVEDVDGSGIESELRRAQPILDSLTFAP